MTWLDFLVVASSAATCAAVGLALGRLTHFVAKRFASRTTVAWDDALLAALRGPLSFGFFVLTAKLALLLVPLPLAVVENGSAVVGALVYVAIFFSLIRVVDATRVVLESSGRPGRRDVLGLIQIGGRLVKLVLVALGALALLSHFGFSVTTLVAGLGLGGLAIGLAAQKTLSNLFGGVSLALDQPFHTGDFVRVGDLTGTVETIGLRSTALRTLDRTLVSIPNGDLADARIESYTARDRIRLACTLGLVYSTSASAMRTVLTGLERVLREHPKIWPDTIVVRFVGFGASSLDVEVMAWFQVTDWNAFQAIREEVLLAFMEVVEGAGSSFAFPTQTVHLERGGVES
jgi:MscS family membrane protein